MARIVALNERGRRIGETHPRARWTDADVELVLALRDEGLSYREISRKFDDTPRGYMPVSTVRDICKGLIRAQIPAGFKRCE